MAYNWNRSGERVIPISIDGDGPRPTDPYPQRPLNPNPYQPQPAPSRPRDPYLPHPPVPPTRRHYGREDPTDGPPNYPPPSVPVPPASRPANPSIKEVGRSHPDFRSHELDEMDTLAEMLKQKREAENKLKSQTNPYRNNYAEAPEDPADADASLPEELDHNAVNNPVLPGTTDGASSAANPVQMGFFMPTAPTSEASNLPYPVAGSNGGLPPYPPVPSYGTGLPQFPPYPNSYQ